MKTGTGGACLLCSAALILSACGSAASFDYELPAGREDIGAPQATMRGITMGEETGADPDLLRFALEWFPASPAGKRQLSQPVNYQWSWKYFQIDIMKDPPVPAIEGVGAMQYGQAEIIFYEDGNRNEELDLVPRDRVSPDRIIGRAEGVRVWWLGAGSPASPEDRGYKPIAKGWSFTYGPIEATPEAVDCSPGQQMGETWKPLCPPSRIKDAKDVTPQEPFIVTTSRDPKLQAYACLGFWGTSSDKSYQWSDKTPGWSSPEVRAKICNPETCDDESAGKLDLPVAGRPVKIQCASDGTIDVYTWRDCEPDPELCGTVFCHDGRGARSKDSRPNGWPCPDNG